MSARIQSFCLPARQSLTSNRLFARAEAKAVAGNTSHRLKFSGRLSTQRTTGGRFSRPLRLLRPRPQADAAIDALVGGIRVGDADMPAPLVPLFASAIQGFLISAFSLDPVKQAEHVRKPILIIQGEADLQVGISDAEALEVAAPSARLIRLPNTNHVLKAVVTNDVAANVATYADPSLPLAPGVMEAMLRFVKEHEGKD